MIYKRTSFITKDKTNPSASSSCISLLCHLIFGWSIKQIYHERDTHIAILTLLRFPKLFDVAYDFLHMQNKFGIQIPQGLQKSWYLEKRFIIVLHGLDFSYETKNVS